MSDLSLVSCVPRIRATRLAVLNREVSASVADRLPWEHGDMGAWGQVKYRMPGVPIRERANRKGQVKSKQKGTGQKTGTGRQAE
jgi:hypothetical protein